MENDHNRRVIYLKGKITNSTTIINHYLLFLTQNCHLFIDKQELGTCTLKKIGSLKFFILFFLHFFLKKKFLKFTKEGSFKKTGTNTYIFRRRI